MSAAVEALAAALVEQTEAAAQGTVEDVARAAARVERLIAEAQVEGLTEADRRRLRDLIDRAHLALTQQREELRRRQNRISGGRKGLAAYKSAVGGRRH